MGDWDFSLNSSHYNGIDNESNDNESSNGDETIERIIALGIITDFYYYYYY